jgi:hypothetical protein
MWDAPPEGNYACAGGCLIENFPKMINELNQGNSQLIFLVPKTDYTT